MARTLLLQRSMKSEFLSVALDLSANLAAEDRHRRLIAAVRSLVPCDAVALLRLDGEALVPIATAGLRADVDGRRFLPREHPRLARLLAASGPVRFGDSGLPDPFDGLVEGDPDATARVHACMGCKLVVEGETVGVLTLDALDARAFDGVDDADVATIAALAGAAMRTAHLIDALEASCRRQGLVTRQLRAEVQQKTGGAIIGQSDTIARLRHDIALCADADVTVLVTGETGVGKELVARALHDQSGRRQQALIYVNCAALPESIAESELFGHVRGAFTGAFEARAGRFEAADRGTIFLDEVGELPLTVQPKLLRVLQEGELQRVGSDKRLRVDVRVIAATNRDIVEEVRAGRFRDDLYHRLAVYPIAVPPLRERLDDVAVLAGFFLDGTRAQLGLGPTRLTPAALDALGCYDWPGNVRELEHVMLRAALRAAAGRRRETVIVDVGHLGLPGVGRAPRTAPRVEGLLEGGVVDPFDDLPLAEATEAYRRRRVAAAVAACDGNWAAAARVLGMNRGNLHRLGRRLGLIR